jgi:hypothetical protein
MKSSMPVIAGRILRTLTLQLKWILLRYGLIESRIWHDLGRTYAFAESQGFAAERSVIYPGLHGESSAREEFLKALMFSTSAPDNLPPAQIHIAERTIAHFAHRFVLQPTVVPGCHFYFDLSMHKPPVRISKSISMGPMVRFFGAGDAGQGLQELISAVDAKDGVPDDVNLGGNFDKATTLPVLTHLKQFWADTPPLRGTTAFPIRLAPSANIPSQEASGQGSAALLLSDKPDKNGEVAVLMRAGSFMQTQSLQMRVRDKNYLLAPSRLVEGGNDFDWAQYKVSNHR